MNIPQTAELQDIARRIVWFEPPAQSLKDPVRFLAYAMRYATFEDMRVIRKYISDKDFSEALNNIPPGIVDKRSWAYWNAIFGRYPAPPMPVRQDYLRTAALAPSSDHNNR